MATDDESRPPPISEIERRLLAEIRERPDDDGPRTVYADHLLAKGDPRGEFIVAGLHGRRERADELWAEHPAWRKALPSWAQVPEFHRGFVSAITLHRSLTDLMADRWKEVVALTPVPVVKLRAAFDEIANVHLRDDGARAAVIRWARDASTHTVDVIEVPTGRGIARARHTVTLEESFKLLDDPDKNRLRWARDRNVITYEIVERKKPHTKRRECELAY